jgi:hypothetical protein
MKRAPGIRAAMAWPMPGRAIRSSLALTTKVGNLASAASSADADITSLRKVLRLWVRVPTPLRSMAQSVSGVIRTASRPRGNDHSSDKLRTRSRADSATSSAINPPMEWPTSAICWMVRLAPSGWLRPNPRLSNDRDS